MFDRNTMHNSFIVKNGRYNRKENECIVVTYILEILGAGEMGNRDDTNGETNNLQQVTRLRDSSIQILYTNILGYIEYFATIGQVTSCGLRSPDEHLTGKRVPDAHICQTNTSSASFNLNLFFF